VLDFGLVKEQRPAEDMTQLTADGLTTGTPAYMAPEMAIRERSVGPGTDIYSLGCVAYWLLTGKLVFEGETPMAIVVEHVRSDPEPPSTRTELPVPPELDAVILRCLAKKPEDRFASMRELSRALAAVPLDPPWSEQNSEEWWQLHRPRTTDMARAS
jgi:serine/threonine-protein kinase